MKEVPLEPYPSDLLPFQCVSMDTWGLSLGQLMVIGTFWFSWIICPNILKLFQLRIECPLALQSIEASYYNSSWLSSNFVE